MDCARQMYICKAFHFTGHRCVEKFMTRFRIDGHTIKRGNFFCISVIVNRICSAVHRGVSHDGRFVGGDARNQEPDGDTREGQTL